MSSGLGTVRATDRRGNKEENKTRGEENEPADEFVKTESKKFDKNEAQLVKVTELESNETFSEELQKFQIIFRT